MSAGSEIQQGVQGKGSRGAPIAAGSIGRRRDDGRLCHHQGSIADVLLKVMKGSAQRKFKKRTLLFAPPLAPRTQLQVTMLGSILQRVPEQEYAFSL